MCEPPNLWVKARDALSEDEKEWFDALGRPEQLSLTPAQQIDEIIHQTRNKKKELGKSRGGQRKCFDNIVKWLDTFKSVGDVISSFDPVHAALPWAAFRFVLQIAVAKHNYDDDVIEILAWIPHFLFTGQVLESLYTPNSMRLDGVPDENKIAEQSLDRLRNEVIKLYSGVLSALKFCAVWFEKRRASRTIDVVVNSSKPGDVLQDLKKLYTQAVHYRDALQVWIYKSIAHPLFVT
ncbi:hypothetical protein GCG54_00000350 [Colletotrichum gloeosporioides]|uniref:NWD NACHT-NTPase N-terminal domain-containing protein n=1 Tax=Colletotrichum gloeosporioides TaxID=474922 RepID=A0A8H4FQ71_COLGL|nr:uncharacterized protein GCG54_00000350 [Colletotrichum gloeosporioides]KAF3810306.1 hypothetical protein GCG54_00000350 [Colletotrichum gloeosporioides]